MSDFMMYQSYALLSTPDAPPEIVGKFNQIATRLKEAGYVVRTTGGDGPETQIESLVGEKLEVYLPWKGFNNRQSPFCKVSDDAVSLVARLSRSFSDIKPGVQRIIGNKAHVILGKELTSPVKFMVVWSPDGAESVEKCGSKTGFVSMAIKVASSMSIPVFNLKNADALDRLSNMVSGH